MRSVSLPTKVGLNIAVITTVVCAALSHLAIRKSAEIKETEARNATLALTRSIAMLGRAEVSSYIQLLRSVTLGFQPETNDLNEMSQRILQNPEVSAFNIYKKNSDGLQLMYVNPAKANQLQLPAKAIADLQSNKFSIFHTGTAPKPEFVLAMALRTTPSGDELIAAASFTGSRFLETVRTTDEYALAVLGDRGNSVAANDYHESLGSTNFSAWGELSGLQDSRSSLGTTDLNGVLASKASVSYTHVGYGDFLVVSLLPDSQIQLAVDSLRTRLLQFCFGLITITTLLGSVAANFIFGPPPTSKTPQNDPLPNDEKTFSSSIRPELYIVPTSNPEPSVNSPTPPVEIPQPAHAQSSAAIAPAVSADVEDETEVSIKAEGIKLTAAPVTPESATAQPAPEPKINIEELEQRLREKLTQEITWMAAREAQEILVSEIDPKLSGLDVASVYEPAKNFGGDWWHHFDTGERVFFWIGDSNDRNTRAALTASAARAAAALVELFPKATPAQALLMVNRAIHQLGHGHLRMSLFIAALDKKAKTLTYSSAGHDSPILARRELLPVSREKLIRLSGVTGPELGASLDVRFQEAQIQLAEGDRLLFFTDGLKAVKNPQGHEWNALDVVVVSMNTSQSAKDCSIEIANQMTKFRETAKLDDDVMYFCVQVNEAA
jgi:serine phosphatase RsbU (regulator of sigma subunit)